MVTSGAPPQMVDALRRVRRRIVWNAPLGVSAEPAHANADSCGAFPSDYGPPRPLLELPFHRLYLVWTCCAGRAGTRIRSEALDRMLLSDVVPRFTRERVPTKLEAQIRVRGEHLHALTGPKAALHFQAAN